MSQSQQRTATIGECLIEVAPKNGKDFSLNFAGDTLNTAVYLVRSLSKTTMVTVDYVTALGTDTFSHEMLNQWVGEGIGVSLVRQIPDKLPGLYLIRSDEKRNVIFITTARSRPLGRFLKAKRVIIFVRSCWNSIVCTYQELRLPCSTKKGVTNF